MKGQWCASWTKELKVTNPLMSSLLVICLGWCSNFVGSNMVYSTIQHPPPPSHTQRSERRYSRGATVHKYCSFIHGGNSSQPGGGFIKGILRGVRCTKSLIVLFLHRRPPSWTTLVLYSRAVFIFNEPALGRKYKPLSECISSV